MNLDDIKFPDDWREVDKENVKRIALLEAKFMALEKKVLAEAENLDALYKYVNKLRADVVTMAADEIYLVERLDEAYYHVFPERFEQDRRFERQLKNLMRKPKPKGDADPKDA